MLSDIVIDSGTTPEDLFQQILISPDFSHIYADLISNYPNYETMIREAWIKSSIFNLSFSDFRNYIFNSIQENMGSVEEFD